MIHEGVAEYIGSVVDGLAFSEAEGGNVFIDHLPSEPDRAVAVYNTSGPEADSKLPYDPVRFQVMIRCAAGERWALTMAERIYDKLHGFRNGYLPDGTYAVFVLGAQADPFRLGADDQGRQQYTVNYRAEILRPTVYRPG